MNFKRLSDAAHIAKLSLLHCYQGAWADKAMSAKVIGSLMGRAARTAGNGPFPRELCGILEAGDGWWSSSQVEWLVDKGLYIRAIGDPPTALPSEPEILYLATDLSTDLSMHARTAELQ